MAHVRFIDRVAAMRFSLYPSVQNRASVGRCALLVLGVCVLHYARPAQILAQEPAPSSETVPIEPSPRPVENASVPPAPPPPVESPVILKAREHIGRGETAFELGNYAAATSEMQAAYALLAGHPLRYLTLYNIASCYQRMLRYELAIEFYERYLQEAPPDDSERAEIRGRLAALKDLLATLKVEANVASAELLIDGHPSGKTPARVLVTAGLHRVELRAPGRLDSRAEIELNAGETKELRVSLEELSFQRGLHPVYFWSGVGLTGAALVVGSAFGIRAVRLHNQARADLASDDPRTRFASAIDDPRPTIRRNATAADIAFGAAAIFGVSTLVLYAFTDFKREKKPSPFQPVLGRSFVGVRAHGAF
jgi:tetratricopeptide (TPR) repeat protein